MHNNKTYSLDKKKDLVENYLSSGKSLRNWCLDNQISKSTFYGWLKKYENEYSKASTVNSDFIEIKCNHSSAAKSKECIPAISNESVSLEYKGFKLTATSTIDIPLVKEMLRVVISLDV